MILIVKSNSSLFIAALLSLSVLLSACGQPGPLYLPKPPAKPATAKEAAAPATAPSAAPAGQ